MAKSILKKKMSIETDYYDDDNMCREYEYIACNGMDLCIENEEEFNKALTKDYYGANFIKIVEK